MGMDYERFLSQLSDAQAEGLHTLFTTQSKPRFGEAYQRPTSYYGAYNDATSIGFREPSDRSGQGYKLQNRSGKTVFADTKAAIALQDWLNDEHIGTTLKPDIGKDGKLQGVFVEITDAHPARQLKPGQVVSRIPVTTTPTKGLHPVELIGSGSSGWWESPMGKKGTFHIGSPVQDVKPYKKIGGKLGAAAALTGAASAAKAGEYGRAADLASDLFVLPFAESRELNSNESEELDRRRKLQPTITKSVGGAIKMPSNYSKGSWKLI